MAWAREPSLITDFKFWQNLWGQSHLRPTQPKPDQTERQGCSWVTLFNCWGSRGSLAQRAAKWPSWHLKHIGAPGCGSEEPPQWHDCHLCHIHALPADSWQRGLLLPIPLIGSFMIFSSHRAFVSSTRPSLLHQLHLYVLSLPCLSLHAHF